MADIILFKPKAELRAEENLSSFIKLARNQLTVFGAELDWDAATWKGVATFAKLGVATRKPLPEQVMDKSFIEFAKAYLRYQQGHKPTRTKNEGKALRGLEAALLQVNGSADIEGLSASVLDEAAQMGAQCYSRGVAYQCGRELERLAKFVSDHKLISRDLNGWCNPINRAQDTHRTGRQGKLDREKKLPNKTALNAIAEVFANHPENERDIFTTSVFAMLMSAPSRITEILALPVDCEVIEQDRSGVERYGWRFFAGKGFEGDIKWIPSTMVSVAKEAVSRAKKLSANARLLAQWIDDNPGKFFRHPDCPNVREDLPLTMEQACRALGLACDDRKACRTSLGNRKLATEDDVHSLGSLWQHVLARLPEGYPWFDKDKGIKFSNALFPLNKNQLHGSKSSLPVELFKPTSNLFNHDLSPRESLGGESHRSIFDRHGYLDESGNRLKMRSHQARHLLNTIAQRGGLSNLEIAKWSGRADVRQNRTYNHMTEFELVGMAERLDPSKEFFGPSGAVAKHIPVSIQEFNTLEHGAAHVTEFGYCVHDYTMSPCEKYRDCINCTEHVCIKGDSENLGRIKERLAKSERLFGLAEIAIRDGDMGADRWYQYQHKTVVRLRELVGVLEAPDLEEGAQIKLRGNDFSQLRRVADKKSLETVGKKAENSEEAKMLEDLTALLGGGFG